MFFFFSIHIFFRYRWPVKETRNRKWKPNSGSKRWPARNFRRVNILNIFPINGHRKNQLWLLPVWLYTNEQRKSLSETGLPFEYALRDGVLLCKLMNKLAPGIVPKINTSGGDYKMMDNISQWVQRNDFNSIARRRHADRRAKVTFRRNLFPYKKRGKKNTTAVIGHRCR